MPLFYFLSASKHVQKSYELLPDGSLEKHNYPFIYEVTSLEVECSSTFALYTEIRRHASFGRVLLKGLLERPLNSESRAGSTSPDTLTEWVCLDLDNVRGYESVDVFLAAIGCADVSYVLQWSSSMHMDNSLDLRCHVFMLLDRPTHPQILKQWLMDLNLRLGLVTELTRTENALRWPLDITTCQNDKLIYIAPPHFGPGVKDPFEGQQRIIHAPRSKPLLTLPTDIPSRETVIARSRERLNELREARGLAPRRKNSQLFKYDGLIEYMANPDRAIITGMKQERGFTYLNLNGGDSWGYFHPDDNPTFIFNFKGEPTYRTEDLLPEYWARIKSKNTMGRVNDQGRVYFAFRDFASANYINGYYDTNGKQLVYSQAKNETQLRHFMTQHSMPQLDFIPDWNLVWDPHSEIVVDPEKQQLNVYIAPELRPSETPYLPPVIEKIISHVMGNDAATIQHFLNWLATIRNRLRPACTAWVLHGTEGTGKGLLYHKILTPLFGEHNVTAKRMDELESQFTGFMENKFIVFLDEVEAGDSLYRDQVSAKLRNLIVEPYISIRQMHRSPYMAPNYANLIFASNKPQIVVVAPGDRRYNVAPYQSQPLQITPAEVDAIAEELPHFLAYLLAYPYSIEQARTPLKSAARDDLINISELAIDGATRALREGNLEFFWDQLSPEPEKLSPLQAIRHTPYQELVKKLLETKETKLSRDEIFVLLDWCVGNMPTSPHKFSSLLKHHRLLMKQVWKNGRNVIGTEVAWAVNEEWRQERLKEIKK